MQNGNVNTMLYSNRESFSAVADDFDIHYLLDKMELRTPAVYDYDNDCIKSVLIIVNRY